MKEDDGIQNLRNPVLSVVIALVSDTTNREYDLSHLAGCLEALQNQHKPPALEVIVPYPAQLNGITTLQQRFPKTKFAAIHDLKTFNRQTKSREHHDELRAHGLALAQGQIIALLEDHARPDSNWSHEMTAAHRQGSAAVGGAIENAIDRPLNWAVYFCDFGKYQNPLPSGRTWYASDANTAYKSSVLAAIRSVWQHSFHETLVNNTLLSRGEKLVLSPKAIVYQHRLNLRLRTALEERFIWGRSYAASRSRLLSPAKRALYALLSPLLPGLLLVRMTATVLKKQRHVGAFMKAFPYIILLLVAWSLGESIGYITEQAHASGRVLVQPVEPT